MLRTLLLATLLSTGILAQPENPNIVFILADDLGYGDVAVLNPSSRIQTPSIDRLAAEGMTFTDAHTPSAVCTPTRYGLLTGRYSWRGRLKKGVINGYGDPLIEQDRQTVASFLKEQGYATGIVGKWHLGLGFARGEEHTDIDFTKPVSDGPHTRGFDFSFIIPASLDFPPYVYIRNGQVTRNVTHQSAQDFPAFLRAGPIGRDLNPENTLDDLTTEAVAFIHQRAPSDQPFFLYFPLTAPHKPVLPHRRFDGSTDLGPYGDFVTQVDWVVGRILGTLDALELTDNTLVFVTSDNGSFMYRQEAGTEDHTQDPAIQAYAEDRHTSNGIFRGTKADIWEAGHHVPFFARWPGKIQAGSTSGETMCLVDFFATVASITGGKIGSATAEDSHDLMPLFQDGSWDRAPVIHHSGSGMFAIRDGKWKLVAGNGSGGREKPIGEPFARPFLLFDLSEDPSETTNVIEEHPEIARRLRETLEEMIEG